MVNKTPNQIIKEFKHIIDEAAEIYGIPAGKVTRTKFAAVSRGRLGQYSFEKCGGFSALRGYVTGPKRQSKTNQVVRLLNAKRS